ncbi:hypothetical protein NBH00_02835 [Paraconexibacter antarcticus]|uniref:Twin-arginine translocation signal domain-containing protein n=1 Tax=Paraconexibacter antarcticus TaxID=2949664 RepID=A0ABY5DUI3_9ACTN|nr:hypothetical protein [Paraconexibacter antarcticus]UTI65155.1 hypothetical protein NBH00_02835 [Paraconexibacter antarcticus]
MDEFDELKVARDKGRGMVARLVGRPRQPPTNSSGTSRRAFLRRSGGYAAGVAATVGVPTAVLLEGDAQAAGPAPKVVANPITPVPGGPVMAYVHDAKKGTVVIMSGTTERTVQDHDLVRRLLHAPKKQKRRRVLTTSKNGG